MMKFFRKYMKHLLAVFMALLLVVWLGGQALRSVFQNRHMMAGQQRGVAFGQPVRFGDLESADTDTQLLSMMGIAWQMPWLDTIRMMGLQDPQVLQTFVLAIRAEPLDELEWYMLDAAARHAGIYVPDEAVERFKRMYAIPAERLQSIRHRAQVSLDRIDAALRGYIRVLEAVDLDNRGVKPSWADIEDVIRRTQEKVRVAAVVLDSSRLLNAAYIPTDEELQAQFERGRDRRSNPGNVMEPGYLEPEKAQVEFIAINADALSDQQRITEKEAYEYWEQHKDEFVRPQPATEPEGPVTQPAEAEPYGTFTEAKQAVLDKLRGDKARVEALRLARDLIGRLNRPWREMSAVVSEEAASPEQEVALPAGVDSPELYPQLIEAIEQRYPGVLSYGRTQLADTRELSTHPQIGQATWPLPGRWPVPLAEAAMIVEGLEAAENEENPAVAHLKRHLYETCSQPFADDEGNVYVFRTVAVRQQEPPDSWEEIRDQLADDVRRRRAFDRAGELADTLADAARQADLKTAFEANSELKQELGEEAYNEPEPFARERLSMYGGPPALMPNWVPVLGMDKLLFERCFEAADDDTPSSERIFAHAQGERGRWLVVQVRDLLPVTAEEFDQQRALAFHYTSTVLAVEFLSNWFDSEQIRTRIGWQDFKPEQAEDEAGPEPVDGSPAPETVPASEPETDAS